MGQRLAKPGAIIALVGVAIISVGVVFFALSALYAIVWSTSVPSWLVPLDVLVGVGAAIVLVGLSLALWGIASGTPTEN